MGAFTSRQNAGVEELDIAANSAYRYPPKSGCYFGSHFIMGGERFDTTQPEAYLFGENSDLNFLGNRPLPFPYPAPQPNEPTKTLKSLVNIRKDSLRLVRVEPDPEPEEGEDEEKEHSPKYNVEFTFDTDVKVGITIHYFATEEIVNGLAVYTSNDPTLTSETVHYKRGASQMFSLPSHVLEPSMWNIDDFSYDADKQVIPMVIQCCVEEEEEHAENLGHAHMLFATFEKNSEECFTVKPLKQKQMVDGLCYLLQEIYGIENKNSQETKHQEDDIDDSGSECVICMSDIRDTLILPCRHLCLCNGCADSLRYQASNCPICRQPFRALLQMRAMRKKTSLTPAVTPQSEADEVVIQENIPPGYEVIPLIEALNGPSSSCTTPPPPVSGTHEGETLIAEPLVVTMPPSPQGSKPQDSVTCRPKSKSKRKRSGGSSLRGTAALEGMSRQQQAPEAKLVAPPCDKSDRSDASSVGTGPYVTTPDDSESAMSPSIVSSVPPSEVDISERSSLGGEVTTPETPAACSAQVSSIGTPGITPSCTVDGDLSQQDPEENRPGPSGANLKSFVVPRGDDPRKGATAAPRDYDYVVIHEESHGDDEASENDDDEENENDDFEGPALRVPPIGVMRDAEAMDIPASDKTSMDNGCVELSLPGTPLSSDSSRSGNSVSSTRQLLSTPSNVQLEEEEESHISPLLA
ncbi:E3 ubiquitin-protein ligase MGRN1-like isoform X9 [Branchiostoma floridae x Branchiostoma belcheri]